MDNNIMIKLKQKLYFANKKVEIIKIYDNVHLVKIRFESNDEYSVVDISALSLKPDYTSTLSLRALGG